MYSTNRAFGWKPLKQYRKLALYKYTESSVFFPQKRHFHCKVRITIYVDGVNFGTFLKILRFIYWRNSNRKLVYLFITPMHKSVMKICIKYIQTHKKYLCTMILIFILCVFEFELARLCGNKSKQDIKYIIMEIYCTLN